MKQAGEIIYSTVNRVNSREGSVAKNSIVCDLLNVIIIRRLVEFQTRDDMERAIDELDGTKLDGRRIKLVEEASRRSRSRSRSGRSRSRSRSRSRRSRDSRSRSSSDVPDRFGRRQPSRTRSQS